MSRTKTPASVRVERKVDRSVGPNACHIWFGGFGQWGVPQLAGDNGKSSISARRVIWERTNGPLPPKRWVTTTCGNKACVNPGHLALRPHNDPEATAREEEEDGDITAIDLNYHGPNGGNFGPNVFARCGRRMPSPSEGEKK